MLNGKKVTYQFFDSDALPQPVQRQNGLDGRHAARVLLDERLPVDRLVILEISWRVCARLLVNHISRVFTGTC